MRAQHTLLCLAMVAAAAGLPPLAAHAQSASTPIVSGAWKQGWWGRTALGLSVSRSDFALPCQAMSGSCEELSVVGRASIGESKWSLTGRVGSMYPRTYALGNDNGFGLSYGAGVSWDFSPRASATLNWDLYDLRGANSPVRSTSLGLQWRY